MNAVNQNQSNIPGVLEVDPWLEAFIAKEYAKKMAELEGKAKPKAKPKTKAPAKGSKINLNAKVTAAVEKLESPIPMKPAHFVKDIICICCGGKSRILVGKAVVYSYKGGTSMKRLQGDNPLLERDWEIVKNLPVELVTVNEVVLACSDCYSDLVSK